jgi:hypothetical protein
MKQQSWLSRTLFAIVTTAVTLFFAIALMGCDCDNPCACSYIDGVVTRCQHGCGGDPVDCPKSGNGQCCKSQAACPGLDPSFSGCP